MNAERLLQHFDRIADAPDAVAHLRRFILDLAVRGKLVDQDPNDEPASELLKQIQSEKVRFIKEGKIKNQKPLPVLEESEIPFKVPEDWIWVRLGSIGDWGSGSTPPRGNSEYYDGDITWLKSGELGDCLSLKGSEEKISNIALQKCSFRLNQPGDVLIAMYGATIGKLAILGETAVTNQAVCGCTPFNGVLNRYLFLYLLSRREAFHTQSEGGAQPNISKIKIILSPISLPPLAEQHRIVAKVDELMGLCDRLESAQQNRESQRDLLVAASLHHLNQSAETDGGFGDRARFYFNHLSELTVRSEHIKQLRQTILNLAVRGKLVPQNPDDEHSSELLKRIQIEKLKSEKAGLLKKDKSVWEGLPKEAPYTLPLGWVWARIQDIFEISRGGSPRPAGDPRYFGGSIPWITVREITKDSEKYLLKTETGLTEEGSTKSRFINPGDLLLTNSGATLGVPKISKIKGCMNDGVAVLRLFHTENVNDFAFLYLNSQTQAFRQINQGMGQPNLNTPIIAGWFFPLPPLAEQARIIAKVDELMGLCDRLETQLSTTQANSRRLLESLLHEAIR
jgi:type I restriction enzyme, S subunit